MKLEDKVVVITGGAGLLGRVFVETVVANGGTAVIADISQQAIDSAISDLSKNYSFELLEGVVVDITSKDSIQNAIVSLKDKFGKVDALVNNAYPRNKNYGRKFEDVEYEDFCDNVSMHLGGYFLITQQFAEFFKAQGHGNVVFISSIYGVVAPDFSVYEGTSMTMPVEYAAIKSALLHLAKYIAVYYAGNNIRCNSLCPGGIENGQPQKFLDEYKKKCLTKGMLDSKDMGGTLLYLLSDDSKYLNGQTIVVDDGFSI